MRFPSMFGIACSKTSFTFSELCASPDETRSAVAAKTSPKQPVRIILLIGFSLSMHLSRNVVRVSGVLRNSQRGTSREARTHDRSVVGRDALRMCVHDESAITKEADKRQAPLPRQ